MSNTRIVELEEMLKNILNEIENMRIIPCCENVRRINLRFLFHLKDKIMKQIELEKLKASN